MQGEQRIPTILSKVGIPKDYPEHETKKIPYVPKQTVVEIISNRNTLFLSEYWYREERERGEGVPKSAHYSGSNVALL